MSSTTGITIGNFDGMHVGHVQLVRVARAAVGEDSRVIALAFDPHPSTELRGRPPSARLTTFAQRTELLRAAGADDVVRLTPSREFLGQEPEQFLTAIIDPYRPDVIIEGPDFRFGRNRTGSVQTLREAAARHGFRCIVIDPVEMALTDHSIVRASSTTIRWLLQRGRVSDAARLLGRPYELIGPVVVGDRRGRDIGFPTANLDHQDLLLPADGIYAATALRNGVSFPAAVSVGVQPTFGAADRVCEAHLLGYDGPVDDYGWILRLQFHCWLRDQIAFAGVEPLVDQMRRDIAQVQSMCALAE